MLLQGILSKSTSSKSTYIISPKGGMCSKNSNHDIDTSEECEAAASKLNLHYMETEDEDDYPKGCYSMGEKSGSNVYFNRHRTGTARSNTYPICISKGNFLK